MDFHLQNNHSTTSENSSMDDAAFVQQQSNTHGYAPRFTESTILCCKCGISMTPNAANTCLSCLRNEVDITADIPKSLSLYHCKNCSRYLSPPDSWVVAGLESKELMALILKRLRGLNKVRLVDACFLWTEPHSKRIKARLTIQAEAFASTILQQSFVVEAVVNGQQCPDCCKIMAKDTWKAVVQVRQKVDHKRTFLLLEQLIIKHGMYKFTTNIKARKEGLDFFFPSKSSALKMVSFIEAVVPTRYKTSEQLISLDKQSGHSNFRFTYSVEIVPSCKDDLVCLPTKHSSLFSGIGNFVLVSKVGTNVHLINPATLNTAEVSSSAYWKHPFVALASLKSLSEFIVIDLEPIYPDLCEYNSTNGKKKYSLADVIVARASDLSTMIHTRSHLGAILKPGDTVLGYDLQQLNFNNDVFESWSHLEPSSGCVPDVILVKKHYPRIHKRKTRIWKLKHLEKEEENSGEGTTRKAQEELRKQEEDMSLFIQSIEEDSELRSSINLYKNTEYLPQQQQQESNADDEMDEEEDIPEIQLAELLDDLTLDQSCTAALDDE